MNRLRLAAAAFAVAVAVSVLVAGCDGLGGDRARRDVTVGLYENAPKVYTDEGGRPAGLFVELLEAVARAEGWRLDYVPCEWAACLKLLEAGRIDLMPDVAFSIERARRYDFHQVSVANSWSQVYAHPDRRVQSLDDLAGLRVAILEGGIQQDFLAQLLAGSGIDYRPVPVGSLDEGYRAVLDGRADAIVTNSFFAARNGHKYRLAETPIVFLPSTLYFASANGTNLDLLARIDLHLEAWRRDAGSIYYDAMRRTMAAPPELLVPHWVGWSLAILGAGMLLLYVLSLLLRWQVAQRTRALLHTTEELQTERANLEHQVAARTAELRRAKEEAERLSRVKSDFLANMSHEVRTPMNAILGMLYLALKSELPPAVHNQLSKAQGAAHSLLGIINDILDLSKIEAGKLEIEQIEFNLDTVLEQLGDAVGFQAERKGIEFLIRYDPSIPTQLVGDPLRLGQVLLNLCGNAVKFTEHGEVELAFQGLDATETDITLRVCVRDSGIGMSPEVQQKLFEKFSQADQTTTRRFGGTGLGLAISKNLVELMGGRIWVEASQPGRGTTMCFSVPLRIARQAQARQRALVEQAGPLRAGVRALVVDDNEVSRAILAEMLRFLHLEVVSVPSGVAALAAVRSPAAGPFDLVLIDWRMPGMNGDEVVRRIRNDPDIAHKPKVVMVTAYGREDVFRLSEQAGVDGFLVKPVSPSTLLDTVLSVLGRGRLFGEDRKGRDGAFELATSGQLAGAQLLLVEDNDINREFAGELLRSEGIVVDEAHNGLEAVEKVRLHAYDAVLMDVQMPQMDGLEAARRIRALGERPGGERHARLPIIAMTALAMAKDAEQSRAAGIDDHVTKPIAPDRLMAALAKWVVRPAGEPGAAARLAAAGGVRRGELPAGLAALTGVDAGAGVRRIGGKPDAYRRQLHRFAEHYRDAVDELRRLAAQSGPEQAGEYCHALKGVAGNLGAQALFEQVAAAEACYRQGRHPDEAALDRLHEALQRVVAEIDGLDEQASGAPGVAAAPLGPEQVRTLIERLDHALRYDVGAADALVETLRGGVAGTPLAADVAALAERIDVFDLDAALAQLHTLQVQRLDNAP
jgi:signal transduction histidine kinase/CheY-like chemotaxis protein/HPt (histidine-containing phosphotransfer) domain-containing protein